MKLEIYMSDEAQRRLKDKSEKEVSNLIALVLANHLISLEGDPEQHVWVKTKLIPEIGMGATIQIGTDRIAGTIIEVSKGGQQIVIQQDHYCLGPDGHANTYQRNPEGRLFKARESLSMPVKWQCYGAPVGLGHRSAFKDPSF